MDPQGAPILAVLSQINSELQRVTAGAQQVVSSLADAQGAAQAAATDLAATSEAAEAARDRVVSSASAMSASVEEAEKKIEASTRKLQGRILESAERSTLKLKELQGFLEQQQDPGSVGLLASLQAFEEGLVDKTKLLMSFGDSIIFYRGEMILVRQLLDEILPASGQVQKRISDLRKDLETERISTDEILQRLEESHFTYAQVLGQMVEGFRAGRVSLEEIQRTAAQLQRQFEGSEAATIAQQLAERAREGRL